MNELTGIKKNNYPKQNYISNQNFYDFEKKL